MATQTAQHNSIGFLGILQLIFITLKLTGHITWSWFWVLSPIIFSWALVAAIVLAALVVIAVKS